MGHNSCACTIADSSAHFILVVPAKLSHARTMEDITFLPHILTCTGFQTYAFTLYDHNASLWLLTVLLHDSLITFLLQPFTNDFPQADIHKLLLPNILYLLIKGTFKDHLVTWVQEHLVETHGKTCTNEILDDIDCQYISQNSCDEGCFLIFNFSIAIVLLFSGVQ